VARWKIISGARAFYSFPGRSVEIGWARDVQRGDIQRTINVCVAKEAELATELPPESRSAIRSHGRSAVNAVLTDEEVPFVIDVTVSGLVLDYVDPDADDEDDDLDDEEEDEDEDEDDDDLDDEDDEDEEPSGEDD
jgi:hypothetical protein